MLNRLFHGYGAGKITQYIAAGGFHVTERVAFLKRLLARSMIGNRKSYRPSMNRPNNIPGSYPIKITVSFGKLFCTPRAF